MRVLISGGTGLVGSAVTASLRADGATVNHLVRGKGPAGPGDVRWNPTSAIVDVPAMEGFDAIVHLSGASIAKGRWTSARKQVLRSSRVDTTRVLVDALARVNRKPSVFICASGIGYYGSRGDEILTESSGNGSDFLGLVCRAWEAEAARASANGIRTAIMRFGPILSPHGGALPAMAAPFRLGLGGRLGSGKQWMSWIALEDVINIIKAAIAEASWNGPFNVVSPTPLRNAEFTRVLAGVLHRPAFFAAPRFALRVALGEMADTLLLASQRVVPEKLQTAGYRFRQEILEAVLFDILGNK
ncbi:MAG TPA: TIGR01777 family oxidoreductase [Candidatus Acidoferrales bacterium]